MLRQLGALTRFQNTKDERADTRAYELRQRGENIQHAEVDACALACGRRAGAGAGGAGAASVVVDVGEVRSVADVQGCC